jgi:hypothetical protein
MLVRILNPYRISVSSAARNAGLVDRSFPNKKAAEAFVRQVRKIDPSFCPSLRITFRYYDTATGSLYASRFEYEAEESRRREWLEEYEAKRAGKRAS